MIHPALEKCSLTACLFIPGVTHRLCSNVLVGAIVLLTTILSHRLPGAMRIFVEITEAQKYSRVGDNVPAANSISQRSPPRMGA